MKKVIAGLILLFFMQKAAASEGDLKLCPGVDQDIVRYVLDVIVWQEIHIHKKSEIVARRVAREVFDGSRDLTQTGMVIPTHCNVLTGIVAHFQKPDELREMLWIAVGESMFYPLKENLEGEYSCGPTQINLRSNWTYALDAIGIMPSPEQSEKDFFAYLCQELKYDVNFAMRVTRVLYDKYTGKIWSAFHLIDPNFSGSLPTKES